MKKIIAVILLALGLTILSAAPSHAEQVSGNCTKVRGYLNSPAEICARVVWANRVGSPGVNIKSVEIYSPDVNWLENNTSYRANASVGGWSIWNYTCSGGSGYCGQKFATSAKTNNPVMFSMDFKAYFDFAADVNGSVSFRVG